MTAAEWIALAAALMVIVGAAWKQGRDSGEIKAGVKELLTRTDRTDKRVDTIELRINDHTERIARLEGREG